MSFVQKRSILENWVGNSKYKTDNFENSGKFEKNLITAMENIMLKAKEPFKHATTDTRLICNMRRSRSEKSSGSYYVSNSWGSVDKSMGNYSDLW